jgi:hypothetical protein
VVWYGGPYTLRTCPVRELDPEADFYIDWFTATHHATDSGWVMTHLPASGGVGAQDAQLMEGIAFVRDEANAFMREQQSERARDRQAADHAARVEQEARN